MTIRGFPDPRRPWCIDDKNILQKNIISWTLLFTVFFRILISSIFFEKQRYLYHNVSRWPWIPYAKG